MQSPVSGPAWDKFEKATSLALPFFHVPLSLLVQTI